jgi:tetratricopeptide (TPR) repeat protein
MDRLTAAIIGFAVIILAIIGGIWHYFGIIFLTRLILGLAYLGLFVIFAIMFGVLLYARSFKYNLLTLIGLITSAYALYQCYTWKEPIHVGYVTVLYILAFIGGVWWITEPDLSFYERIRSASSLEKSGNFRAAARKYEKAENYSKAAENYIKAGMMESAAWCFEKAEEYEKAAELYEKIAEEKGEIYYWKEAHEFWKKVGDLKRAARCLEKYAEDEPWYWEDVAKMWEEIDREKAEEMWKKALDYYIREAEEEGVFWEDVARIQEKLGEKEGSKKAWEKFLEYCLKEAEEDESWWKHVAEAYENLGEKEKADEAMKRYEEYRKKISTFGEKEQGS